MAHSVIPVDWDIDAEDQEMKNIQLHSEFEVSLASTRPCLKNTQTQTIQSEQIAGSESERENWS